MTDKEYRASLIERHGEEVYEKLISSSVAIAGLGGLGSNVAINLARAGVGELLIVDFDRVDISNLNRQYYTIEDIGKYKTDALEEKIKSVNPIIKIKKSCTKLNEYNINEILGGYNIVCECFDRPEAKATLVNTLLTGKGSTTIIAASGMAGYGSSNSIVTKKINNKFYICGDGNSGIEDGICLFAPRVSICAGHQANMALRLLLGIKEI